VVAKESCVARQAGKSGQGVLVPGQGVLVSPLPYYYSLVTK